MRQTIQTTIALISLLTVATSALACPFCSAVSQTFSEEFATMEVVVLAKVISVTESEDNEATPKAMFKVTEVIKGEDWIEVGKEIEQTYYGDGSKERTYLLSATDPPSLMWSSPLGLSDVAVKYVKNLSSLPKDAKRLEFFQDYLEHEDEMLARDAYDEFAKTPYDGVIALKPKMKHDKLVQWIRDSNVPATRRRLYFTMLGICGQAEDIVMLEDMMKSGDRKQKAGLDAMLACYLMLKGEKGLPNVDELFLKNKKAEYSDTYSAIMAIRFHGSEADVIERKKLVLSLRHILERPNLADLVIPDLARWEDWEVMPRLVDLFVSADEKSSWVRVPVINYLRACPLPEAEEQIAKLKEIDPDSVKRAMTFFPFNTDKKEEDTKQAPQDAAAESGLVPIDASAFEQPLPPPAIEPNQTLITSTEVSAAEKIDTTHNDSSVDLASLSVASTTKKDTVPTKVGAVAKTEPDGSLGKTTTRASSTELTQAGGDSDRQVATVTLAGGAPLATALLPNPFMLMLVPVLGGIAMFFLFRAILGLPTLGLSNRT